MIGGHLRLMSGRLWGIYLSFLTGEQVNQRPGIVIESNR